MCLSKLLATSVQYARDARACDAWCRRFVPGGRRPAPVALDAEWVVSFRRGAPARPTAVLQLAAWEEAPPPGTSVAALQQRLVHVGVFHICHVAGGRLPSAVLEVLRAADVQKVGVKATADVLKLQRDGLLPEDAATDVLSSTVDLDEAVRRHDILGAAPPAPILPAAGAKGGGYSLSALRARFWPELAPMDKRPRGPRLSDWERGELTEAQLRYAAADAACSLRLSAAIADLPEPPAFELPVELALGADVAQEVGGASLYVPPRPPVKPLALSKEAVWRSVFALGGSINRAAEAAGLKRTTVAGYVVEGMQAGKPYVWGPSLSVPADAPQRVHRAAVAAAAGGSRGFGDLAAKLGMEPWMAKVAVSHLRALQRAAVPEGLLGRHVGSDRVDAAVWKLRAY